MKVNIVTMNSSYNYGAALQAYALQQKILSFNVECSFIDQRTTYRKKACLPRNKNALLKLPHFLLYKNQLNSGYAAFEDFVNNFQIVTDDNYSNYFKLKNNPPNADVFITGSDQVFNTISCKPINFLEFVPPEKNKISYAASMGIDYIVEDKIELVREYLNSFTGVSVREESAAIALSKVTNKEIEVNIDPVFLLDKDEWKSIQTSKFEFNEPYILCYILFRPPWLNRRLRQIHKQTKKKIVVVDLSLTRNIYRNKFIRNAGPREFLELMDKADCVITSSFHGTALSIIYKKPFYAIINPKAPSRIQNLLDKTGLNSRILKEYTTINFENRMDFSYSEKVIIEEQKKATKYLFTHIKG